MNTPDDDARGTDIVRLLTSYQRDIYLYVRSLVLDPDEAAEIVQNTNLCLWEKRNQAEPIKDFRAWAFQVARFKLLEHRAQRKRRGLCFSDALIDELALQAPQHANVDRDLIEGLRRCVARLTLRDRELLVQRYSSQISCQNIAKSFGRSARWVYNSLNRIRQELLDCMDRCGSARREP